MKKVGRPKSYTEQDIVNAVKSISEKGKKVTGSLLRMKINKGRPDSLLSDYEQLVEDGKIVQVDKQKDLTAVIVEIEHKPLPSEIADCLSAGQSQLESIVRQCNDNAHNIHEQRVANEIKKSRHEVEVAQLELQEISKDLDESLLGQGIVEEERDDLVEQLTKAKDELKQAKEVLSSIIKERDDLLKDNEILNVFRVEGTRSITAMKTQLELKDQQFIEAKSEFKQEIVDRSTANTQLAEKLAKVEQAHEHLTAQNQSGAKELDKLKLHASKQVATAQELRDTVTRLTVENRQVEVMQKQLDASHKQNEELHKTVALLLTKQQESIDKREVESATIA